MKHHGGQEWPWRRERGWWWREFERDPGPPCSIPDPAWRGLGGWTRARDSGRMGPSLGRSNFAMGAACLRLSSCRTAVFSSAWTGFCAQRLAPVCMASMSDSKKLQKCVVFLFLVFILFSILCFSFSFSFSLRFSSIVPTPLCRDLLS